SLKYFSDNIRTIQYTTDENGHLTPTNMHDVVANDADAFRHAYTSAIFAYKFGDPVSKLLGNLNELWGNFHGQPAGDAHQDYFNNEFGINIKDNAESALANLADEQAVKNYLLAQTQQALSQTNGLMLDTTDSGREGGPRGLSEAHIPPHFPEVIAALQQISDADVATLKDAYGNYFDALTDIQNTPGTSALAPWMQDALDHYDNASKPGNVLGDPLVLDLNHNGFELISQANSNVHFDLTDSGFAAKTGWVSGNEGFLVQDANNNGTVDGITELFGSEHQPGLQELATLDSNHDGVIDANDTDWGTLKIWQDANANGITDSGEMHDLSDFGITALNLASQHDGRTIEGNFINDVASFTANGVTGDMGEMFFSFSSFDTDFIGTGGMDASIDPFTLLLPQSRGYGALPSLSVAMTQDATLKGMVENLGNLSLADYTETRGDITGILFQWAHADQNEPSVTNYDPERLSFLEKFSGEDYTHLDGGQVDPFSAFWLDTAWSYINTEMTSRLLVTGMLSSIFPNAFYDFSTDTLSLGSTFQQILDATDNTPLASNIHFYQDLEKILFTHMDGLDATKDEIASAINDKMVAAVSSLEDTQYGLGDLLANLTIDNNIDATPTPSG